MTTTPIGLFDSGFGGLSIWSEIRKAMPGESTHYIADSGYAPYGEKPKSVLMERCHKLTQFLLEKGCKLIVVACNTATTNAISELREAYEVPFIGIEPAIKPAALRTTSKHVGVLATKGTLSSQLFHRTRDLHTQGITLHERVGSGLVEAIEKGALQSAELRALLQTHLQPLLAKHIDVLVLGCTHYPFLQALLQELLPPDVQLIDSGEAVARQTKAVLQQSQLLAPFDATGQASFYSSGNTELLGRFLGEMGVEATPQALRL